MVADQRGALIIEIVGGSPAEEAGLQGDDLIVAIEDQPVEEFEDLVAYLERYNNVGESVTLTILRDGRQRTVEVTLAARPGAEASPNLPATPAAPVPAGAWLGIRGMTVTPEIANAMSLDADQQGILIEEVMPDSPADEAGFRGGDQVTTFDGYQVSLGGDIIIAADGELVGSIQALKAFLSETEPGQEVAFSILRDGKEITVDVVVRYRPESTR